LKLPRKKKGPRGEKNPVRFRRLHLNEQKEKVKTRKKRRGKKEKKRGE